MANKNDERILALRKQIQEKKEKIGKIGKFIPETNCSLELDGVRYNLNVVGSDKDLLTHLKVRLNLYLMSAKDLGIENTYTISGYSVQDWIKDVNSKLDIFSKKEEEKALSVMEAKLEKMLSDEKQVELELDAMASLLNLDN